METRINENMAELCGVLTGRPVFSHKAHEKDYYLLNISAKRASGTEDFINVLASHELVGAVNPAVGDTLCIKGELRSFNNKNGQGSRLVITVFAKTMEKRSCEPFNRVALKGTLCKEPIMRRTPLGREICDVIIAVNRRYGRADYLPCIIWGKTAQTASELKVGYRMCLEGRIQSRNYVKVTENETTEKTAFEVSVSRLLEE